MTDEVTQEGRMTHLEVQFAERSKVIAWCHPRRALNVFVSYDNGHKHKADVRLRKTYSDMFVRTVLLGHTNTC